MRVERVKILEMDDSLRMLQPARSIEIRTDRGRTATPDRCVTSYEFNRKARVPTPVRIRNPVSVYGKFMTGRDVEGLLETNGWFKEQVRRLEKSASVTEYSALHVPVFELAASSSTGPSPADILRNERNLVRFLKQMIAMQHEAGYGIMSVPYLGLPLDEAKKAAREAGEAILRLGGQPLFSVDVRRPGFEDLLDYFVEDMQVPLVNLRYGKRRDFSQQYLHLERFAGRDVAFLMTGVSRADSDHHDLSTMHYMPFLGNDLFAIEAPFPVIPKARKKSAGPPPLSDGSSRAGGASGAGPPAPLSGARQDRPMNVENLRALHRDELTILPITDPRMSDRAVLDLEGNPVSEDLRLTVRNVREAERDLKKYSIINALTRIQELLGSTAEFSKLAGHIRERSSRDYVRGKKDLEARLKDV